MAWGFCEVKYLTYVKWGGVSRVGREVSGHKFSTVIRADNSAPI